MYKNCSLSTYPANKITLACYACLYLVIAPDSYQNTQKPSKTIFPLPERIKSTLMAKRFGKKEINGYHLSLEALYFICVFTPCD